MTPYDHWLLDVMNKVRAQKGLSPIDTLPPPRWVDPQEPDDGNEPDTFSSDEDCDREADRYEERFL